jgi:Leucine rich repeat
VQHLDVGGLRIRDLGTVFSDERFGCLTNLSLENNQITSITPLAGLMQLRNLNLNTNRMGACMDWWAWQEQNIDNAAVADVATMSMWRPSGLQPLPNLVVLQLADNKLTSMEQLCLTALKSLRTVFLQNNQFTRIAGLNGLHTLQEVVRACGKHIRFPSLSAYIIQLDAPPLHLTNCVCRDDELAHLQVLDNNRIRTIDHDSFDNVPALREVHIQGNTLRRLSNLSHLLGLFSLHAANNRIADFREIERLEALTALEELTLAGCPLSRKPGCRLAVVARLSQLQVHSPQT